MSARLSTLKRLGASGVPLLIARLIVGGLFIYMGIMKVAEPVAFLKLIKLYEILPLQPPIFINATAITLPWIEIVCGVALVTGVFRRGAAVIITVMLLVFTPAILIRAIDLYAGGTGEFPTFCDVAFDCGCGGGAINSCRKLAENSGLLVLAVFAIFSSSRRFCLAKPQAQDPVPVGQGG